MRTNDNGQGVIFGINTDNEDREEAFKEDQERLQKLFMDKHTVIASLISRISEKENYAHINMLSAIQHFALALISLEEKNLCVGSISYSLNHKKQIKLHHTYKQPILDECGDIVGMDTKKVTPELQYIEPYMYDFDTYLEIVLAKKKKAE